ncbi:MAG: hypothetical protein K6B64_02635, partial [Acholeplasmatales bacterium]|nr:hypothetical protein [Acholeplasmatales bacterium]
PAISKYTNELSKTIWNKTNLNVDSSYERAILNQINHGLNEAYKIKVKLDEVLKSANNIDDYAKRSMYLKTDALPLMESARLIIDEIELNVDKNAWPVPSYGDILYSVK